MDYQVPVVHQELKHNMKGFTLLELIIVIAIMAMLSVGAAYTGTYLVGSIDLSTATHNITTALETARDYTLDHFDGYSNYGVHFTSNSAIIYRGTTYSSGSPVAYTQTMPADISITSISFNSLSYVYFNSVTALPSNTGSVQVNAPRSHHVVSINADGIVNIQ